MSDDPRPLMARALDQIGVLVDATRSADLDRPTPCPDWDVRTLLGHLVGVPRRVAHVGTGGSPHDVPSMVELPDGEYASAFKAARAAVDRVWGDDAVLDRMLTVPWGTLPGRAVGFGYVQEFTVHAWDLAVATGRTDELDAGLAAVCEPFSRQMVPAETRGGPVPFGPVVEVGADADPYARLVGWLGRDPRVA